MMVNRLCSLQRKGHALNYCWSGTAAGLVDGFRGHAINRDYIRFVDRDRRNLYARPRRCSGFRGRCFKLNIDDGKRLQVCESQNVATALSLFSTDKGDNKVSLCLNAMQ